MPPTRRPRTLRPLSKRGLTRRRSRRTTWIELLAEQKTTQSTMQAPRPDQPDVRMNPGQVLRDKRGHAYSQTPISIPLDTSPQFPVHGEQMSDSNLTAHNTSDEEGEPEAATSENEAEEDFADAQVNVQFELVHDNADTEADAEAAATVFEDILRNRYSMIAPATLIALTLLNGTVKFSVKQYEIVRVLLKHATENLHLPSYSVMQRKYFPHLIRSCFPRSKMVSFPRDGRNGREHMESGRPQHVERRTRVVFPTEWARIDVATLPYYENIFRQAPWASETEQGRERCPCANIEEAPIVRNRDVIVNPTRYLFVDDAHGTFPAAAGDTIMFDIRNIPAELSVEDLRHGEFGVTQYSEGFHISGKIQSSWCVGSTSAGNESSRNAISSSPPLLLPLVLAMTKPSDPGEDTSAEEPHQRQHSHHRFFMDRQQENGSIVTGDICTLLAPSPDANNSQSQDIICCLILSRCLKNYDGMASQLVMWIRLEHSSNEPGSHIIVGVQRLSNAPRLVSKHDERHASSQVMNIGKLKDGRLFATYRMLLYCDDFKSSGSLYSQASCGGVYLLPLGLPQKARRSRSAVHVISLTPPGVSTNEVISEIIPDIVKGTKGIEGVLPSGEPVVIFLDVVGFIADYPAAAEPLDVLGHTADAPCTHCTIRKYKGSQASAMGFTTRVHASFSPSLRCAERHNTLRERELSDREYNILGMKSKAQASTKEYPLITLREQLLAARPLIPLTSEDIPVVTGLFDPFRSSIVAPDHLLSGLARNIIDLCFKMLRRGQRNELDVVICCALEDNGLPRHRSVFNDRKIQLHSMSLSSVFSILLVLQPVCHGFCFSQSSLIFEALHLANQLKDLVAMTYWSPSVATDGREAYEMMRSQDGRTYHTFLQRLAERYVTGVDKFCSSHPDVSAILDKPNLHRLLELYHHSIPAFGHVSLFQELVFETAHQPLKRSIERGNHGNTEASAAVEHCLGNDWQARIGMLYTRLKTQNEKERQAALNGLRQLVIGRNAMCTGTPGNEKRDAMNSAIEKCLSTPLIQAIRSNGTINHALVGGEMRWMTDCQGGPSLTDRHAMNATHLTRLLKGARRKLLIECGMFNNTLEDFNIRWRAKRKILQSDVRKSLVSANDVLSPGTIIQAMIGKGDEKSTVLRPQTIGECTQEIFMALGFLDGGMDNIWVAAVRCQRNGRDTITIPKVEDCERLRLLQLNEGPRRVGVYHMCRYSNCCEIDQTTRSVRHRETSLSGGSFRIQTRSQGYPPRLA